MKKVFSSFFRGRTHKQNIITISQKRMLETGRVFSYKEIKDIAFEYAKEKEISLKIVDWFMDLIFRETKIPKAIVNKIEQFFDGETPDGVLEFQELTLFSDVYDIHTQKKIQEMILHVGGKSYVLDLLESYNLTRDDCERLQNDGLLSCVYKAKKTQEVVDFLLENGAPEYVEMLKKIHNLKAS